MTSYVHPPADAAASVTWLQATGQRPFLTPLDRDMRVSFLAAYEAELEKACPRQGDGRVLLRFPRLFVVARRG